MESCLSSFQLTSDGFSCIVFHAYSIWEHVVQKLASSSLIEYLHLSKWKSEILHAVKEAHSQNEFMATNWEGSYIRTSGLYNNSYTHNWHL